MSTFVTVGNARQPFRRLLEAVAAHAHLLPPPVVVQHGHTPFAAMRCQAVAFMDMDEFAARMREADLVIMHAGAGAVIHALEAGKRPMVMPRRACYGEHVNDHQTELAEALASQGRVVLVESADELAQAVQRLMANGCSESSNESAEVASGSNRMMALIQQALAELMQERRGWE